MRNVVEYFIIFYFLCGICLCKEEISRQQTAEQWEHQEEIFTKLINSTPPYNARLRPSATKNTPVTVYQSLFLYSMASVDELRTDYTMQLLFRQTWHDERLDQSKFPVSKSEEIFGDDWHAQRIWKPAVHVVNDNDLGSKNDDGKIMIHITPEGKVILSKRVKLRPFCKMEFYRYPMDQQQCTLEIESSILPTSDMELKWAKERPLDLNRNFVIAGFKLANYSVEEMIIEYPDTGNFSRIIVRFDLKREIGHFVLDIYVPSMLFVVTSWLSFWVEIPAAPARVTLGMTTMLTLVTSEKAVREKLPKVSYVHVLDIWNVVCTAFVFASLVEYALVNYIYHKDKRRRKNKYLKRAESAETFTSTPTDIDTPSLKMYSKKGEHLQLSILNRKAQSLTSLSESPSPNELSCVWPFEEIKLTPQDIANGIDRKCRYIFPIGFIIFNIIYWLALWL